MFNVKSVCSLETKIVRIYRSARSQLHIALVRNYMLNIVMITSMVWYWLSNTEEKVQKAIWLFFISFELSPKFCTQSQN